LVGLLMTNMRTQPVLKSNVDTGAVRTPSLATALEGLRRAEQLVGPFLCGLTWLTDFGKLGVLCGHTVKPLRVAH
jgi:hypothetical protein